MTETPQTKHSDISAVSPAHPLTTVTSVSKILAATVFVILPFVGFFVGTINGPVMLENNTPLAQESFSDPRSVEYVNVKPQTVSVSPVEMYPSRADLETFLEHGAPIGYVPKDIRAAWPEIRRKDFIFQGEAGAVTQRCDASHVFLHDPLGYMCLGSNAILLEWKNQMVLIDFYQTPNVNDLRFLSDAGFNEGAFTGATSTMHDVATLYAVAYQARCLFSSDMCAESPSLAYKIDFPSLSVSVPPTMEYPVRSMKRLSWNDDGTRAVMMMLCGEGCPKEETVGVDVMHGKELVLTYWPEYNSVPSLRPEDVVWLDKETVRIREKEYTF